MTSKFGMGVSGKDNRQLLSELCAIFFKDIVPDTVEIDREVSEETSIEAALRTFENNIYIRWKGLGSLSTVGHEIVLLNLDEYDVEIASILVLLEQLSFEIASFASLYDEWYHPDNPYEAPSFGNGHMAHGWACAFKGDGFKRLVSRRWLDYGPWKQYKSKHQDLQLIQFHELGVDSATALSQCKEGHRIMGISSDGGYIQHRYVYQYENQGVYDPNQKTMKIIVHGKDIPNRQLLDACAARLEGVLGNQMPVEKVTYIFMEEEKANAHLKAIWLRGLECRTIKMGKEVVLTDGYNPPPKKPDWALKIQ